MRSVFACSLLAFMVLSAAGSESEHVAAFKPHQMSYDELVNGEGVLLSSESFLDALSDVGVISITDLPEEVKSAKQVMLSSLHSCAVNSRATKSEKYSDGTIRRTMATHTIPGPGGMQQVPHTDDATIPESCYQFTESSNVFRSAVDKATREFSKRLSLVLETTCGSLLATEDGGFHFETVADVVENGEHLEHFHSYQREEDESKIESSETINMHTDQGLLLVFTPGIMVSTQLSETTDKSEKILSKGFYIGLKDGSRVLLDVTPADEIVFMLGDGVNQVINPKLSSKTLRATPHTLTMPTHDKKMARVWYGRMVLPPFDAIHPEHSKTFGELRRLMIDASLSTEGNDEALTLGCSRNLHSDKPDSSCGEGTLYCWSRCMNHTEYFPVSPDICASDGKELKCVNPRDQLYVEGHGDFFPACTDSTVNATDFPTLPGYEESLTKCTDDAAWKAFANKTGYSNSFEIGTNEKAVFQWNVEGSTVDGRLSYRGLFGFLAIGYVNPGGGLGGMSGASIIMALPGGNYSAVTGLDLDMNATILEYVISEEFSRFRHWSQPVGGEQNNYGVEEAECFTALTFKTDSINAIPFNVSGVDQLLWAANGEDSFVEYHNGDQRDKFNVNWATGEAWMEMPEQESDGLEEESRLASTKSSASSVVVSGLTFAAAVGTVLLFA